MSRERGEFDLFGLFRRRGATDWDVVVAAPWAESRSRPTIQVLVQEIGRLTGSAGLMLVSRIIVGPDRRFAEAVASAVTVSHGLEVVGPGDYGPVEMAGGYVITSRRSSVALA